MEDVDLKTPKPYRSRISATSTVDRSRLPRKTQNQSLDPHFTTSLGLLSLTNVDTSNIYSPESALKQQRILANKTLERANKVSLIPSKLLKPAQIDTEGDTNLIIHSESTVNDSDLLSTPKNTSTPRPSSADKSLEVPSIRLRDSMSQFTQMLESNMSMQSIAEKFLQVAQSGRSSIAHETDSGMFIPAEEAASKLLADEMSWKRKHDLPVAQNYSTFEEARDQPSMSIGEFFQQRSDPITDLRSLSPKKSEPLVLVSSDILNSSERNTIRDSAKSFSISAIQQLLSEPDHTPNKVIDYLLNQKEKPVRDTLAYARDLSGEIYSLPVSGNSSYTTSVSDNEAIKMAVQENKENVSPSIQVKENTPYTTNTFQMQNSGDMKIMSPTSRSSSSLTSLPNGKLPIESTKNELVWGAVKVDRCATKEFLLRNKTSKTLRLQCSLSSYEFKIRKDNRSDSDFLSTCKFYLHGHESRPLIVSYIPTKVGAAIDELSFTPLDPNLTQTKKQCVKLWGYGGYANVEYRNAVRDNTGKYWLSLGRLDNKVIMENSFNVKNTGNLPSFTYVKLVPKPFVSPSNLRLEPNLFVLLPNEEKIVKVTYTPSSKDGRILKQSLNAISVVDLGRLEIVFGPEVSRARLRRLFRKAEEKGLSTDELSFILKKRIPSEVFPSDINKFKESPGSIEELLDTFVRDEIGVTIEQDPNQTLVPEYPEDSALFQTLCQDTTTLINETQVPKTYCRLEPPSIILCPPDKTEDALYIVSRFSTPLHFEVSVSPGGIQILPGNGTLNPGQTLKLQVKLLRKTQESVFKVQVHIENEVFEAEVKLMEVKSFFLE